MKCEATATANDSPTHGRRASLNTTKLSFKRATASKPSPALISITQRAASLKKMN